jgi:hypothetical protein
MPFQLQREEIRRKRGEKTNGRLVVVVVVMAVDGETYLLCEGVMVLEGFAD